MNYLRRLPRFLSRPFHSATNTISVVNTSWSICGCHALSIAKITSLTNPQEYKNGGLVVANCSDWSIGVTGSNPDTKECQFRFWLLNNDDPRHRIFCLESVAYKSHYLHWDKTSSRVDLKEINSDADKATSSKICWSLPTIDVTDPIHTKILLQAWDGQSDASPWYLVFDFDDPQDMNDWKRTTSTGTPPIEAYLLQNQSGAIQNAAITLLNP